MLKEKGFRQTEACNHTECAVKVGELLGVEKMLFGEINEISGEYVLTLIIVDVSTSKFERGTTAKFSKAIHTMIAASKRVATDLVGRPVSPGPLLRRPTAPPPKSTTPPPKMPPPKPVIQTGDILVKSNPVGASVLLNGEDKGTTTDEGLQISNIKKGVHEITIRLENYQTYTKNIYVSHEETTHVERTLRSLPGSLFISSAPSGAAIYLNDILRGKIPTTIDSLIPKMYHVRLSLDRYKTVRKDVIVKPNRRTTETWSLSKSRRLSWIKYSFLGISAVTGFYTMVIHVRITDNVEKYGRARTRKTALEYRYKIRNYERKRNTIGMISGIALTIGIVQFVF